MKKFNSTIVAKKTPSNTKKCIFLNRGQGRRERTRRKCHFPKITKPKKFIFNGQKKGEKKRIFFSRLKSHKTKCKVINPNKRRKPRRKKIKIIYIYTFTYLCIYI
jgi:hypothetical protein